MFTRARLAGLWILGSVISPAELEHLDDYSLAIDGDAGGTYAPSAAIVIGGSGVTLSGANHHVSGTLTVDNFALISIADGGTVKADGSGGADITLSVVSNVATLSVGSGAVAKILAGGALDVYGSLTLKNTSGPGSITAENNTTITLASGATLTAASGSTVNLTGTTNVRGAAVIKASGGPGTYTLEATCTEYLSGETQHLAPSTDIYLAGSASSGSHEDNRTITRKGLTTLSGSSARTAYRENAAAPDSDSDMTVAYDRYSLPTTQAADRVYTVRHTGTVPTPGQRLLVSRMNPSTPSAFKAEIKREDGTIIFTFYASREGFVWLEWNSLAWVPIMSSQYATGTNSGIYGDVW